VPVFVTATAATVSSVGFPATLPVLPSPPIEHVVVAEIVLQEIDDAPLWDVLVRPSPSNEPVTVYFVADVAVLMPSLTETEYAPLPEKGTVKVALTAPVLELVPPEVIVAAVEPNVTEIAVLGLKLMPAIVTLEPTAPVTGLGSPSETT